MDRRTFVAGALCAYSHLVHAQPAGKVARIGILAARGRTATDNPSQALMEGLRDHGYVEGRNLVVEWVRADAQGPRFEEAAAEFVRKNVDVIVVIGPTPLPAAHKATRTIPIVMVASSADPVRDGVAATLARPGGNVTGLTYAEPDRFKKQLELLKAITPQVKRVGVLWDFDIDVYRRDWQQPLAQAARVLDLTVLEPVRVESEKQLPQAIDLIAKQQADAFLVTSGAFMFNARAELAQLALRARLPGMAAFKEFPEAGLLVSWGPDLPEINRRAAYYVDRIMKGAKPGDLPIELPNKFELAINLRTAAALGLAVDPSLRARAAQLYR